jgi:uncharacterized membrane protein YgdD (TMEM256/DUF423 family)
MNKAFLSVGAFSGAIAVALGAFAAHGLKKIASAEIVDVFRTGVQYQMYHTLALLVVAVVCERLQNNWIKWSGYLFSIGIICFSGSLYLITAMQTSGKTVPPMVGFITPVGGLVFIVGWLSLLIGTFSKKSF